MFITFEGGEGSGKSTAIKKIVSQLEKDGYEVILTREPGGTPIGEQIRNVILDKSNTEMDPVTEALLYAACRRQHLQEKIIPATKEGKIVLCDRYLDSSLAYQGIARNLGIDYVNSLNQYATEGFLPDLTILFDLEPEVGLERISRNIGREVNRLDVEKIEFHHLVRNAFLSLAKKYPERYAIIDASQNPDKVFMDAYEAIKGKFDK